MTRTENAQETARVSEQLRRFVAEAAADVPEIKLVYLFGSRVEDDVGPISDYDLGVVLDNIESWPQIRAQFSHKLAKALGTARIDLVLLNAAPVELAYAIIAQGEVLFQRDVASCVEYEARVMSLYGDYLPILREQRRDILRGNANDTRVQRYRAALGRTERTLGQIRATQTEDAR